jgi:hypothetical protein
MMTKKLEKVLFPNYERLRHDRDNYMNIKFLKLQERCFKYIVTQLLSKNHEL